MLPKLRILFLCTKNACRSQMAEAWTRRLHPERFEAFSAGTHPGRIDPRAVRVMAEVAIDMSRQRSKPLSEFTDVDVDHVITVCDAARENCPVFPGTARRLHAGFDDPPRLAADAATEEDALEAYRHIRDEIRAFVMDLPARLAASAAQAGAPAPSAPDARAIDGTDPVDGAGIDENGGKSRS
ncbi:MAG: arsenate reductase ArsC [Acidobacteriota bacterium]